MKSKMKFGPSEQVYKGIIFDVFQRDVFFPDGEKKRFEYCRRPDSVTVFAFDGQNRLLLIKEFRHGPNKNTWFLPAGRVDEGETPLQAAKRELREETGYSAREFRKIFDRSPSNTLIWETHIFAARYLRQSPLKGDEAFPIRVVPTPLAKAVKMSIDGTIENEFIAYNIIRFDYMLKHGKFKW